MENDPTRYAVVAILADGDTRNQICNELREAANVARDFCETYASAIVSVVITPIPV